ncbi:ECF-type sigma factor [Tahibacter amnicola]|uniref:ECF-type sigma factor n=1 Tax=Tahibacter amnicola TaxID=2976241 RepID=A0ABY6BIE2_9GAMM|nr:ECF-type sigma factor [Tahibacter amnicola]UXI69527.1 ECF-type sigma factor [Tahibacter amnicola]
MLLSRWREGDEAAAHRLMDELYPALKDIAVRAVRRCGNAGVLQPTELVNEAYLRLADNPANCENRAHFLAFVSRMTRNVLIDLMRERGAAKRGGGLEMITLRTDGDEQFAGPESTIDWLVLEETLQLLEKRDPMAARIVEMRYFGGMENAEVADVLGVSVPTVVRHWRFARAWLHSHL